MSRISTSVTVVGADAPEDAGVEPASTPPKKPSKTDAAAAPVAETEETP
jgi:hypothetical protein